MRYYSIEIRIYGKVEMLDMTDLLPEHFSPHKGDYIFYNGNRYEVDRVAYDVMPEESTLKTVIFVSETRGDCL